MRKNRFTDLMEMIYQTVEEDITCGECYAEIDRYVDMLQSGNDPATVLPKVKLHLQQCSCCREELNALISILESQEETN